MATDYAKELEEFIANEEANEALRRQVESDLDAEQEQMRAKPTYPRSDAPDMTRDILTALGITKRPKPLSEEEQREWRATKQEELEAGQTLMGQGVPFLDEATAAVRGWTGGKGYAYEKERQNQMLARARARAGTPLATAIEVGSGIAASSVLGRAGITAAPGSLASNWARQLANRARQSLGRPPAPPAPAAAAGWLRRAGGRAADAGAAGAVYGAAGGESAEERASNALWGGIGGALLGATAPSRVAGAAAGTGAGYYYGNGDPATMALGAAGGAAFLPHVTRGVWAQMRGRMNPDREARGILGSQLARAGRSWEDVIRGMNRARVRLGLGDEWTIADETAQQTGSAMTAAALPPGSERNTFRAMLMQRQLGQGERIADRLERLIAEPRARGQQRQTAEQLREGWQEANNQLNNQNYTAARAAAGAVDLAPVVAGIDDAITLGQVVPGGLPNDRIARALRVARGTLINPDGDMLTDFQQVQRARQNLRDQIERVGLGDAPYPGANRPYNEVGRELVRVRDALDDALGTSSAPYQEALTGARAGQEALRSIRLGQRAASGSERAEDNVRRFRALQENLQRGARVGYVDQVSRELEKSSAAPQLGKISSRKRVMELEGIAPTRARSNALNDYREAERQMMQTNNDIFGGSQTARRTAEMVEPPSSENAALLANMVTGQRTNVAQSLVNRFELFSQGMPAPVRESFLRIMQMPAGGRGGVARLQELSRLMQQTTLNAAQKRELMNALLRATYGGAASGEDVPFAE